MKVLLDTNILLDVLLDRQPWVTEASAVWAACDRGQLAGHVSASAITDIFYIARRAVGLPTAHTAIELCLEAFNVCAVNRQTLERALALPGDDFEDNVQIACAMLDGLDALVTRDKNDYAAPPIHALTPAELLSRLTSSA